MDENTNEEVLEVIDESSEDQEQAEEQIEEPIEEQQEEEQDPNMDEDGYIRIDYPYDTKIDTIARHLTARTYADHKLYKAIVNGIELKSDSVSLNTYFMEKYKMTYLEAIKAHEAGDESILMTTAVSEDLEFSDKDNRLIALGHTVVDKQYWMRFDEFVYNATRGEYKGYDVQEIVAMVSLLNTSKRVNAAAKRFVKSALTDTPEYKAYKMKHIKSFIPAEKANEFEKCVRKIENA